MELSCEQLTEIVKLYYECKSATLVIRTIIKEPPGMKVLNRMLIHRLVMKFEVKGTINDTRHNSGIGRPRSARTKENIDTIDTVITETPQKSVGRVNYILASNSEKLEDTYDNAHKICNVCFEILFPDCEIRNNDGDYSKYQLTADHRTLTESIN